MAITPGQRAPFDVGNYMAHNIAMKVANIVELKNNLSKLLAYVVQGEEIEIRKRNIAIARIVPARRAAKNRTKLGCGLGTATILGDLTDPLIPEDDWQMLRSGHDPRP